MNTPKLEQPTDRLGVRQREVLSHMERNNGMWPVNWRIRYATRAVFDSLIDRGLIVQDGVIYRLASK